MKSLYTKFFIAGLLIVNTIILSQHLTRNTNPDTGNLFVIQENKKCGYINKNGEVIIKPGFNAAGIFEGKLARAMRDSLWGFINQQGEFVITPQYTIAKDFSVQPYASRFPLRCSPVSAHPSSCELLDHTRSILTLVLLGACA